MTDWQARDAGIAGVVWGWGTWWYGSAWWWRNPDGFGLECRVDSWQPHKNVAQALMVKDKIMRDDWCFDLSNRPDTLAIVYFWQMLHSLVGIHGKAETDAKAICLAIEAWLNAQKKESDDPG